MTMKEPNAREIRVLLVGGGTGGHFFPLISIAEKLNETYESPRLYYAGPTPYNRELLEEQHITFVHIPAGKWRRYFSLLNFFDLFKTAWGTLVAIVVLFRVYPDVVFSKGGFASVPIILASCFLRIPIIVHESDSVFGKANKLGSRCARHVITAYETATLSAHRDHKIMKLGIPIRTALLAPPRQDAIEALGVDAERPIVLVLGGSLGAERLNQQIFLSLDELLKTYTVIHQTGAQNFDEALQTVERLIPDPELRKHYQMKPFLDAVTLNDAYHLASVVISRAGSTVMHEIALHHKPAIIVPIPESISHDQRSNAYAGARAGGVVVIEEENLKEGILLAEIERIVQNPEVYESMVAGTERFAQRDAAERIVELMRDISAEHF